jgi:Ca2+-transporting ATPase
MTVTHIYTDNVLVADDVVDTDAERLLVRIANLANDGKLSREGDRVQTLGDPTETALLDLGLKLGFYKDNSIRRLRVRERFRSTRSEN